MEDIVLPSVPTAAAVVPATHHARALLGCHDGNIHVICLNEGVGAARTIRLVASSREGLSTSGVRRLTCLSATTAALQATAAHMPIFDVQTLQTVLSLHSPHGSITNCTPLPSTPSIVITASSSSALGVYDLRCRAPPPAHTSTTGLSPMLLHMFSHTTKVPARGHARAEHGTVLRATAGGIDIPKRLQLSTSQGVGGLVVLEPYMLTGGFSDGLMKLWDMRRLNLTSRHSETGKRQRDMPTATAPITIGWRDPYCVARVNPQHHLATARGISDMAYHPERNVVATAFMNGRILIFDATSLTRGGGGMSAPPVDPIAVNAAVADATSAATTCYATPPRRATRASADVHDIKLQSPHLHKRLHDVPWTEHCLAELQANKPLSAASVLSWNPEGTRIAVTTSDGSANVWSVPRATERHLVCAPTTVETGLDVRCAALMSSNTLLMGDITARVQIRSVAVAARPPVVSLLRRRECACTWSISDSAALPAKVDRSHISWRIGADGTPREHVPYHSAFSPDPVRHASAHAIETHSRFLAAPTMPDFN